MADVTAALSIEAMLGSDRPFAPEIHSIRPHPGQACVRREHPPAAAELRRSWTAIGTTSSTPYRTRTRSGVRPRSPAPPGTRSTSCGQVAGRELVSIVDNPVVLPDGRVVSTGNFHGAPLGFAADFLAIAAAEVGSISERRVDRLLDVARSRDLPAVPHAGCRGQLRAHDRAVHRRRHRRGKPPARVPGQRRLGADERHAGRSRLDGLGGRDRKLRTVLDNLTSCWPWSCSPAYAACNSAPR